MLLCLWSLQRWIFKTIFGTKLYFFFFLVDTTPEHSSIFDSSRVYTRSGRLVKPPLNFWCGQREFVDQKLNVRIEEGGIDYLSMVRFFCVLLFKCILNIMNKFGYVSNRKSPALRSTQRGRKSWKHYKNILKQTKKVLISILSDNGCSL